MRLDNYLTPFEICRHAKKAREEIIEDELEGRLIEFAIYRGIGRQTFVSPNFKRQSALLGA